MAWLILGIAGILEIAFAICMKWSDGFTRFVPSALTVATGLSSVILLSMSLRVLPMGTAYAVWTGIGAVGSVVLGVVLLDEAASPSRLLCVTLIIAGVIGLKWASEA
jgi:quaternary ammonium compound-resistance protein SugE